MENIQRKLQKFSKVIYVFSKIGYVACIVGVCLSAAAIIWGVVSGDPLSTLITVGDMEVKLVEMDSSISNLAVAYGTMAYVLASCAFLIPIMRLIMRLFANMRDNYTPFTTENAQLFKRIAVRMIIAAIVPPIIGEGVGMTCAKLMSLSFTGDFGDGFSMVAVLVCFALSMVFQYGCALQEQADATL